MPGKKGDGESCWFRIKVGEKGLRKYSSTKT